MHEAIDTGRGAGSQKRDERGVAIGRNALEV